MAETSTRDFEARPPRSDPKGAWSVGPRRSWLVTGGCGFIGSHLVDALVARREKVLVLDDLSTGRLENLNPRAQLIRGDVADQQAVAAAMRGVDGCFHLAAVASVERGNRDWLGTHRTNLTGTIAVLDAARQWHVPVVYASSAAVYGAASASPLAESAAAQPLSAYGADKLGCELHARFGRLVHGMRTVGLRFFNVYGPRQDPSSPYSGVISIFCSRIRAGQELVIHGDGSQTRDFVYVDDVVRALMLAMTLLPGDSPVMNVCTGAATSVLQLAAIIGALEGRPPFLRHAPRRAGDVRQSLGDPTLAKASLGFEARTSLSDGLRRVIDAQARVPPRYPSAAQQPAMHPAP